MRRSDALATLVAAVLVSTKVVLLLLLLANVPVFFTIYSFACRLTLPSGRGVVAGGGHPRHTRETACCNGDAVRGGQYTRMNGNAEVRKARTRCRRWRNICEW